MELEPMQGMDKLGGRRPLGSRPRAQKTGSRTGVLPLFTQPSPAGN